MSIKRTFVVTMTKEIEVELPDHFATDEYLKDFRSGLWYVESVEDVAEYAARVAAVDGSGYEHDGLGLVAYDYSKYPRVPDVKFRELSDDVEVEPA